MHEFVWKIETTKNKQFSVS